MRFKGRFSKGLFVALILTLIPITAFSAQKITPGSTCKVYKQKVTNQNKVYTCIKSGKKLIWNKGVAVKKPTPTPTPTSISTPYATVIEWNAPTVYELNSNGELQFKFTIQTNQEILLPKIAISSKAPDIDFTVPVPNLSRVVKVALLEKVDNNQFYSATVRFSSLDPIGIWNWNFSVLQSATNILNTESIGKDKVQLIFTRPYFGFPINAIVMPIPNVTVKNLSGRDLTRVAWLGEHVALFTKSDSWDREVISRILKTLDTAFKSYSIITQFQPTTGNVYKGRIVIVEVDLGDNSCGGGACGHEGAAGIELMPILFERLFNGVKLYDRYDQAIFYELGHNFWDYSNYLPVLRGQSLRSNWFDASKGGFAVFLRYLFVESYAVPGGPWDGGGGIEWQKFFDDMKSLSDIQASSTSMSFETTFGVMKAPYSGPLSINDFWSSIVYRFLPPGKEIETTQKFLVNLKTMSPAKSEAEAVFNFVRSMSLAIGRNIEEEFYTVLRFNDVKGNGK